MKLLKPEQVAERINASRAKAYQLISSGQIESVKIGALRRIPEDAVDAYIARLRAEQAGNSAA
jgi:excisionase family DNA binding protein